ncbi:hypothetical protein [Solirubrobacter soli]|uniref:hypothetical protein n=1 Tax=Solirubrobacter soli TaxID=363832 RepID=UPI0004233186|nr:hypothetical protein [Solirubrobacter soli]
MRLLFALIVVALVAPATAHARDTLLWACHGPDGRALPGGYDSVRSAGTFVTPTSGVPCATPSDTVRVGFSNPAPAEGSLAALRLNAPPGVPVTGVWLGRDVTGPGYFARTSTMDLETLDTNQTLGGTFTRAATGSRVELGMRCASAGCDASGVLDFRFAALVVQDATSPTFSVSGLPPYAAGVSEVLLDARDTGLGLASASATLAGIPLASIPLGGSRCTELSPGDATADLPLAEDCPAARRISLALDSAQVPDGTHRLEITVTDGAGNATVQGFDLKVVNHPPITVTPTPTRTPVPTATPTATPVPNTAVVGALGRYKAGAVAVNASCPARAAAACAVKLTLRAKVPPSKRTATIARARSTVKPGAKAKLTLKLSAAAQRALKKRSSLRATLTLAGAKPVSVTVRRG